MPVETLVASDKRDVIAALNRLPESATLEDIRERLARLAVLRTGPVAAPADEEPASREAEWVTEWASR